MKEKMEAKMKEKMIHTMDYKSLVDLFIRAGLEIHPDDPEPEGLITCLKLTDEDSGHTIGAAGLVFDKGVYIIRCVAVEEEHRGRGFGKLLVDTVMHEALELGAREIWLTAKVPGFYRKFGFKVVPMDDAPFETKCRTCVQYQNGCDSEVMKWVRQ